MRRKQTKAFTPWELREFSPCHKLRPPLRFNESWRSECYLNGRYSVQISDCATSWGSVTHLWIRRHDGTMPRSWSDLQRIKNELIDEDRTAVEVFPSTADLIDQANIAHLWVLPDGYVLPFTL